MYYVVTGAAGFIGSKIVEALNARGVTEIIAVDNLAARRQVRATSRDCEIADYLDKDEFLRAPRTSSTARSRRVLHQGACSDTMETDGRYMMENNYRYSKALLEWCQEAEVPFIYASSAAVYGASAEFREERGCERRSTSTATRSSCSTSSCAARCRRTTAQIAGFRYFNVYGPERGAQGPHGVGRLSRLSTSSSATGRVQLFEGSGGLRRRRAAARFRLRRRRGRREPVVPRAPRASRASSTAAPGARRPSTRLRWRRSTRCRAREHTARELARAAASSSTSRSPRASRASTRASPRPTSRALRAAGYPGEFRTRGSRACAAYVERARRGR